MTAAENVTGNSTMLQTLSGENLTVNNATIITADIDADNGVIHTIDRVLMPVNESKIQDYTVTEEDNNETVIIPLASNVTVRLPDNPSTPHFWNVTVTRGMEIVGEQFISGSGNETVPGGGGIREWRLTPNDTGAYQFTALLRSPGRIPPEPRSGSSSPCRSSRT